MLFKDYSMSLQMKTINPHPNETYRICFDDGCLVISSGTNLDAPKVWLSKSMLLYIQEHKLADDKRMK